MESKDYYNAFPSGVVYRPDAAPFTTPAPLNDTSLSSVPSVLSIGKPIYASVLEQSSLQPYVYNDTVNEASTRRLEDQVLPSTSRIEMGQGKSCTQDCGLLRATATASCPGSMGRSVDSAEVGFLSDWAGKGQSIFLPEPVVPIAIQGIAATTMDAQQISSETSINSLSCPMPKLRKTCDLCRRHKKACNGVMPCSRCVRCKKQCIFSARKGSVSKNAPMTTRAVRATGEREDPQLGQFTIDTPDQHGKYRFNRVHEFGLSTKSHHYPTYGNLSGRTRATNHQWTLVRPSVAPWQTDLLGAALVDNGTPGLPPQVHLSTTVLWGTPLLSTGIKTLPSLQGRSMQSETSAWNNQYRSAESCVGSFTETQTVNSLAADDLACPPLVVPPNPPLEIGHRSTRNMEVSMRGESGPGSFMWRRSSLPYLPSTIFNSPPPYIRERGHRTNVNRNQHAWKESHVGDHAWSGCQAKHLSLRSEEDKRKRLRTEAMKCPKME